MSNLPKAKQEVSLEPSKNAVTSPSDPREKEADVDRKMRFYGVINGFREGKLPSNKQIDETLDYFVNTAPFDTSKLSREGQQLIDAFRQIVLDAKKLIDVKNKDELIQNFIWHTTKIDAKSHAENVKGVSAPVDKDTAQSEGQQAVENLKVLAKLVFTNSEVRKLLSDVSVLGRDVAADAVQKAAEKARPSEHELSKVEEPAPDSQWIGPDGEKRGPNEPVPDSGVGAKVDQFKEARAKKEEVKQEAKNEAADQANQSANRAQNENVDPNDTQQQKGLAQDEANNVANRGQNALDSRVSDEDREKAEQQKDRAKQTYQENRDATKDYLKEKFPEERRDKFIYRLKKVVVEQQQHDDYNQAVDFFIDMAENYKGRAANVADQGKGKGLDVRSDSAYKNAEMELRIILERFANNTSMQPIFDAIDVLYTDANNDEELRKWWSQAGTYVRRVLQETGYIMTDECNEDGKQLRDNGRKFWDHKYKGHRQDLFNSIEEFFLQYNEDPMNKQLGLDIKALLKDLALDGDGNLKYKPHLVNDLRKVIIPSVLGKIGYIPIPRAEYSDKQIDIVIENLTMEMSNILPNLIEIENKNYFKLSPYDNMGDWQQHSFKIGFSQIQADIRDVSFMVNRKSGFPKLKDSGIADVLISGKGISGSIHLETTPAAHSVFRIVETKVNIDEMKFKIRDSKHNFLYNMVRHTATGIIKKSVAKAMESAIRQGLQQLDAQLVDIRDAYDEGKRAEDTTRVQAVKDRINEKQQKAAAEKEKVKETAEKRESQFKLVTSRDQEIIDWESKGSYIAKQGIVKDHAKAGEADGWKSPVFDITHSSPTMDKSKANQDLKSY